MKCPGPKGCDMQKSGAACDLAGSHKGDACAPNWMMSCGDRLTLLVCDGGKFDSYPCRGMGGCFGAQCNQSLSEAGDPCVSESSFAYSVDKKHRLKCVKGVMTEESICLGEEHCSVGPAPKNCDHAVPHSCDILINCDTSVMKLGDACEPGQGACTDDHESILKCANGKMALDSACRGPKKCHRDALAQVVHCDQTVARIGDACTEEAWACSEDKTAALRCKKGQFAVERAQCKCTIEEKDGGQVVSCR
jgi:hypothetical protein